MTDKITDYIKLAEESCPAPYETNYTGNVWGDINNPEHDGDSPLLAKCGAHEEGIATAKFLVASRDFAPALAKALLEAEKSLHGMVWIFEQLIPTDQCERSGHLHAAKLGLAQIGRIKKGEIPADKYLPAPKEDVERALNTLQQIEERINSLDGMYSWGGEIETIRRVLLANAGRG